MGWNWKSVNLESDFEMSLDGKLWTNFQCFILSGSIETDISLFPNKSCKSKRRLSWLVLHVCHWYQTHVCQCSEESCLEETECKEGKIDRSAGDNIRSRLKAVIWRRKGILEAESLINGTFPLFCGVPPVRTAICQHTQLLQVLRRTKIYNLYKIHYNITSWKISMWINQKI